jgi:subtilisin family serine protease
MSPILLTLAVVGLGALNPTTPPPRLTTVIVTPLVVSPANVNPGLSRAARIERMQREARDSQAKLVAFLRPLTISNGGASASVSHVETLWLVNRLIVTATDDVIAVLRVRDDIKDVRAAKELRLFKPIHESAAPAQGKATYGLKALRVPEAWTKFGVNGSGVLVGHLDTGVYSIHPDLKDKVKGFKDFFGSDNTAGFDGQGHGTHTAGTIVGGEASGSSIGVAPGAHLISGRIFNNSGTTTDAIILRAMNWIADPDGNPQTADAPRLVSCSWGGEKDTDNPGGDLWDASKHWLDLGILPVFAAGNSGPFGKVGTPGAYPHVFAIGSTNWFGFASTFSSRGPSRWEGVDYIKPDVCAPGSSITSAKDKGGWTSMSGTSMACPHAAGVVALVLSANPNLNPTQLVDILRTTATDKGSTGKDNTYGWGLLDAYKAVEKAKALATFESRR